MGPATESTKDALVKDLFQDNMCRWSTEKIEALFPELATQILSIKTSREAGPDKRIWLKHVSGVYTTKSGYHAALEGRVTGAENRERPEFQWAKKVWEVNAPMKIKLLIWKAIHGGLHVNERLASRKIIPSPNCVRCEEVETITHVFFTCPFAQETWRKVPFKKELTLAGLHQFSEGWSRVQAEVCLPPTGVNAGSLAAWVIWSLWITRNYRIFQDKTFVEQEVVTKAIVDGKEWSATQPLKPDLTTTRVMKGRTIVPRQSVNLMLLGIKKV